MTRRIKYTKFGLAEDPRGLQIVFTYQGRELLGDVMDVQRDQVTGAVRLIVRHFNGEMWPIHPLANLVRVLEREQTSRVRARHEALARMHGAANDARLWDGWRTYGDDWVDTYIVSRLQAGVFLRGKGLSREVLIRTLEVQS